MALLLQPKNWCFWTVMLEKTLESCLDCKEIKLINPQGNQPWICTEGLMLKLKLQYFGHLMRRANWLEKTLMLGKIWGRRRGWQRMRWLDGITDLMGMNLNTFWELVKGSLACCSPWGHKELDTTEQVNSNFYSEGQRAHPHPRGFNKTTFMEGVRCMWTQILWKQDSCRH